MLDIRKATPLILVINEIVTNSIKYGLGAKQPRLAFYLDRGAEVMTLKLVDNGPGMAFKDNDGGSGLGSQIIKGLVHQMRGEIVTQNLDPGMTTVLTIPTKH
jgi:two-component sensor histidine kinase